ncbi:hypothetical protein DI464_15995 [Salmonella enterica subsp. enterica serovar Urbana]|nr:hypothetical protein [Salmonella enterica]EDR0213912.1 MyfA/PsaA family fimbrial adhesin [Salmonella enterica subsp. enterica serovar Urbana]EDU3036416.1 MyfA/PsaA family fimbrial adhesin [Salmonella enterica subsp. enterica serovar Neudorf]EHF5602521.1 MyfA/PsaA family fimbrial adhesin [Salmonella enterica subsp. enterica serovar Muenchen]EAO6970762.1 hypothetical protein [Salmonella enterica]
MTSSNIVRTAVTTFILACVSSSAFAVNDVIDPESVTASVDVKASGVHTYEVTPEGPLIAGKLQEDARIFSIRMHNDTPHTGFNVIPSDPSAYMTNGDSKIPMHCGDMTWAQDHWWVENTGDSNVMFTFAKGAMLVPGTYKATLTVNTYVQ